MKDNDKYKKVNEVLKKKSGKLYDFLFVLILFLTVFAFYGNSIRNAYNIDDEFVTNGNPRVSQGLAGIPEIFTGKYSERTNLAYGYRPVVVLTFAIEYEFFGFNPALSHLINLLLYFLLSWVIFVLLKVLIKNLSSLFAFTVVLLFIMHPVHTEVVNSLKNRDEILSLLFSLLAWIAIIRFADNRRIISIFFGLIYFLLAILSKPNALVFVLIIPISLLFFRVSAKETAELKTEANGNELVTAIRRAVWMFVISFCLLLLAFYCHCLIIGEYIIQFGRIFRFLVIFSYLSAIVLANVSFMKMSSKPATEKDRISKKKRLWHIILVIVVGLFVVYVVTKLKSGYLPLLAFFVSIVPWFFSLSHFGTIKRNLKKIHLPKDIIAIIIGSLIIGIAATFLLIIPTIMGEPGESTVDFWQNPLYFKNGVFSRIPLAFYSLLFYLKLLIFPHPLGFYYGFDMLPMNTSGIIFGFAGFVIYGALLFLSIAYKRKNSILSFSIMYFIISILMFSNLIVPVAGIIGERLIFGASLAFCLLLGLMIFRISGIKTTISSISRKGRITLVMLLLLFGIPFLIKTYTRNNDWKDRKTLFLADINYLSRSVKANDLTAAVLFQEADKLNKNSSNATEVLNTLRQVIQYYKQAAAIYPKHYMALNNIGIVYLNFLGEPDSAIYYFDKCVKLEPDFRDGFLNLSSALDRSGKSSEAIEAFNKALMISPGDAGMISYLAVLYFKAGNKDMATHLNDSLMHSNPSFDIPFINAGNFAIAEGDTVSAGYFWEKAYLVNPSNEQLCNTLSGFFVTVGNNEKATFYKDRLTDLRSAKH